MTEEQKNEISSHLQLLGSEFSNNWKCKFHLAYKEFVNIKLEAALSSSRRMNGCEGLRLGISRR
jgi:cysteine synthase